MQNEPMENKVRFNSNGLNIEMYGPDTGDHVYIAGNFNDWKTEDNRFKMSYAGNGQYHFSFPSDFEFKQPLQYKYHRTGGWDYGEIAQFGDEMPNREPRNTSGFIKDYVQRWRHDGKYFNQQFYPKIQILSHDFHIPQLIKTRRITALLPHDYHESQKRYPVLYLQDGQNLFDDNAPFGSWEVDKKLAVLSELGFGNIIVIAIDHAREQRINEFSPAKHNMNKGAAEGKKYVRFLAETLKPYVDQNFRTIPDAPNTGIGGSSMGGLISIYAGILYPNLYSKLMIFSPSLWMTPEISFNKLNHFTSFHTKIYVYAGGKESETMIDNVKRFEQRVKVKAPNDAHIEFRISIDPHGTHSEYHWGKEFPKAIQWLFYNQ